MNQATPNLPSRDFAATSAFYAALGFQEHYRDPGWMILETDGLTLEFFAFPTIDPATSNFGCCLRLDDVDAFHRRCLAAGLPETSHAGHASTPRDSKPQACVSAHSSTPTAHSCYSSRTR